MAIFLTCGVGAALSLLVAQSCLHQPPFFELDEHAFDTQGVQLEEISWLAAYPDQGEPVVLKTNLAPNAGRLDGDLLQRQFDLLARHGLRDQVIHVPLGWQNCNCHGWVFTNGQFWIGGGEVDNILRDNRYRPVASPRPGDLAVYRSPESQEVTHTGIVRYVSSNGNTVLVESKWGNMGRFIHPHDTHCYGLDECTFHRSLRSGHRLQGLPSDSIPSLPYLERIEQYHPVRTSVRPSF